MHSGQGEEASDNTYRLLPIPQEPHVPAAGDAREGVVLPAHGEQWDQPTQVVQPAPGQPWGAPQQSPAQPAAGPGGAEAEKTQLIAPYPAQDGEKTQMLAPQGRQDAEGTQLLPPYPAQSPAQAAEPTQQLHRPLPPEQSFGGTPPLPAQAPGQPPMPFAIRPGTPADESGQRYGEAVAGATQQLPGYEQPAQPQQPAQQPAQDDYDYLYRQDGQASQPSQPSQAGQIGMPPPPTAGYTPPPTMGYAAPQYGYGQPAAAPAPGQMPGAAPAKPRGKLSPPALIGIIVAACAVVGLAAGAALSGGGGQAQDAGATSSATVTSAPAAGAGDAAEQAKTLDALLKESNNSRAQVISAVQAIKSCGNLAQAASDLRSAAGQRKDLVTRLGQLPVDKLPNHAQLVAQLDAGWQASAAADEHYAAWADQTECKNGHAKVTAEVQQGNRSSGEATGAKKAAAALWNPIAQQYGLTQRQYSDL